MPQPLLFSIHLLFSTVALFPERLLGKLCCLLGASHTAHAACHHLTVVLPNRTLPATLSAFVHRKACTQYRFVPLPCVSGVPFGCVSGCGVCVRALRCGHTTPAAASEGLVSVLPAVPRRMWARGTAALVGWVEVDVECSGDHQKLEKREGSWGSSGSWAQRAPP